MKKLLYIVLDGLGDRPIEELGWRTPLEAAGKKNLDSLAPDSKLGIVYTAGKGIAPESDVAVISILGYDARKYYTGRGPLESFAEGIDVKDGDLAYRVNFATLGAGREIIDRRVGRNLTTKEASALSKEVNSNVKLTNAAFEFKNTIGHRGVLVIRSKKIKLSSEITNTDPAYGKEGPFGVALSTFENFVRRCEPIDKRNGPAGALEAARLTNEFLEKSRKVLKESPINKKRVSSGRMPANVILTRDGGDRLPKFPKLKDIFKIEMGCFVEMPVEKGIALLTGMDIVKIPLPTGDAEKDYDLRAKKVVEAMAKFDGLYIHIKGPDEPAHDGNFAAKKSSIEAIDKFFFGSLFDKISFKDTILAVTADHSTPCEMKAHSADPVPVLLYDPGSKGDGLPTFGEESCRRGSLGPLDGHEIMPLLVSRLSA